MLVQGEWWVEVRAAFTPNGREAGVSCSASFLEGPSVLPSRGRGGGAGSTALRTPAPAACLLASPAPAACLLASPCAPRPPAGPRGQPRPLCEEGRAQRREEKQSSGLRTHPLASDQHPARSTKVAGVCLLPVIPWAGVPGWDTQPSSGLPIGGQQEAPHLAAADGAHLQSSRRHQSTLPQAAAPPAKIWGEGCPWALAAAQLCALGEHRKFAQPCSLVSHNCTCPLTQAPSPQPWSHHSLKVSRKCLGSAGACGESSGSG